MTRASNHWATTWGLHGEKKCLTSEECTFLYFKEHYNQAHLNFPVSLENEGTKTERKRKKERDKELWKQNLWWTDLLREERSLSQKAQSWSLHFQMGKNLNHQYYLPEIMSQRISSTINHTACMSAKPTQRKCFFCSDVTFLLRIFKDLKIQSFFSVHFY